MAQDICSPKLVLLAGLLCDEAMWEPVARRLASIADVTILHFAGFESIEAMAEHVLHSVSGSFFLAGHSMGGRVAIEVHRQSPSRILGLALLNTGVHSRSDDEPEKRGKLVDLARSAGMTALARQWLPPMMDADGEADPQLMTELEAMVVRATPDSFAGQIQALLDRPAAEAALTGVDVPTLLLSATGDRWSPPAQHRAMLVQVPHARLAIIPDAGHMAPAERPDAVAEALAEWLNEAWEGPVDIDEAMRIEAACAKLLARYVRLNDAGDFEALAGLYTADGVFARPSDPQTLISGRDAILESLRARPARLGRHIVANVEIDAISRKRAIGRSTMLLFLAEKNELPSPIASTIVGHFDDRFEFVEGGWRFAQRLGSIVLK